MTSLRFPRAERRLGQMTITQAYKLISERRFSWRPFFMGMFMALDSYSPLAADLVGWDDPKRINSPQEEEMIRRLERDLLE